MSGTITLNGAPLADADVSFMNDTFIGFGRTNAEGRYKLVQGALPGTNKISISKIEGASSAVEAAAAAGLDPGQADASMMAASGPGNATALKGPTQLVSTEYSDPTKTKLTYEVPAGGTTDVNFDL